MKVTHFFSLFMQEFLMELSRVMSSRVAFIINIFSTMLWFIIDFLVIFTIYSVSPGFEGWNIYEVIIFLGTARIVGYISNIFVWGISNKTYDMVADGTYDLLLLKPINPLIHVMIKGMENDSIFGVVIGVIMVLSGLTLGSYVPTFAQLFFFLIFILEGVMVHLSLSLFIGALCFKYVGIDATFHISSRILYLAEYPINIYKQSVTFFLTFIIPVGVINFYPASYLLGKMSDPMLFSIISIIVVLFTILSVFAYNKGLEQYSSSGG